MPRFSPLRACLLALAALALADGAHAQSAKLVGTWVLAPGQAGEAAEMLPYGPEMTFGADGTIALRFATPPPDQPAPPSGTFSADADTITATVDGRAMPAGYRFVKGELVIEEDGQSLRWRRKSGC